MFEPGQRVKYTGKKFGLNGDNDYTYRQGDDPQAILPVGIVGTVKAYFSPFIEVTWDGLNLDRYEGSLPMTENELEAV